MRRVSLALVHYPVLDRSHAIVTTAITNIDLHDLARSAYTYGIDELFIVHPITAQRTLAEKVKNHWITGAGAKRIPDRTPAMTTLRIVHDLEAAVAEFGRGEPVESWVTSASANGSELGFSEARQLLAEAGPPVLILFGTGWGLAECVLQSAAQKLAPILSARENGYNHLSVRAAVAITLDRLLGVA